MRRMIARYEGKCSICGGLIRSGMEIFWEKALGAVHVDCAEDTTARGPHDSTKAQVPLVSEIEVPAHLVAREKYQSWQTRFYESLAVPREVLETVADDILPRSTLSGYSKWRVDFPCDPRPPEEGPLRTVFAVAHKILTRGRVTLLSPTLEKMFLGYYGLEGFQADQFTPQVYLHTCNRKADTNIWLDSLAEKSFVEDILPGFLGPYYRHWVMPQVDVSSLVPEIGVDDWDSGQRVDFLVVTYDKKVVVELDGSDHVGHEERDRARDEFLGRYGYEVIRIRNDELQQLNHSLTLQDLSEMLKPYRIDELRELSPADKYVVAVKLSHQIQIVTVEALLSGALELGAHSCVYFDANSVDFVENDLEYILNESLKDLNELLCTLAQLYDCDMQSESIPGAALYGDSSTSPGILLTFGEHSSSNLPCFCVQDVSFPSAIAQFSRPVYPATLGKAPKEILEYFLKYLFRKDKFWEGQYETIERALAGRDAVVLLPTGSGKSIAFQLASMLLPGVAVVVDPIIALIEDQIDNLQRAGIDRVVGISSQIEDPNVRSRVIRAFGQGEYLFCYVAPERFQNKEFRAGLRALTLDTPVSLIAIDEAHCVSEWGHDFRPSYLNIGRATRAHCTSHGRIPPLLALTGTASHAVLKDVQRELSIQEFDAIITPQTFDRQELKYSVFEAPSNEKQSQLMALLQRTLPEKFGVSASTFYRPRGKRTFSGLVFCPFVDGDFGVVKNTDALRQAGIQANFYCGRAPWWWKKQSTEDWSQHKHVTAKSFKSNKFPLMVATKAFAMGIDKPNIRFTVHFGIPPSIEAFYQEAGRAGRDRDRSECVLLFSVFDRDRAERLLRPYTPIESILEEREVAKKNGTDDDITRALFFHNFEGVESEMSVIDLVIGKLGDANRRTETKLIVERDNMKAVERAVHRLVVLGVIEDYTIDYSHNEFNITLSGIDKEDVLSSYESYVAGYNRGNVQEQSRRLLAHIHKTHLDFVRAACRTLVEFIYDTIEKGRRRALREMFLLAEKAVRETDCDTLLRAGILRYLESSHSKAIEAIVNDDSAFGELKLVVQGGVTPDGEIIPGIRSPRDAEDMRGQVGRYLESVPNHPGLLFLRAACEAYSSDMNVAVVAENFIAGVNYALNRPIPKDVVYDVMRWLILDISQKKEIVCSRVVEELVYSLDDPILARLLISSSDLSDNAQYPAALYLLNGLAKTAVEILES